jgi:integrase
MTVYKRGAKGVFYMNFTVNGERVCKSTGKYAKKEAKLVEAVEKQKMLNEASLSPQEKAARTKLSDAIDQVYHSRWKSNKNGEFSHRRAQRILELLGDVPVGKIDQDKVEHLIELLDKSGIQVSTVNRYLAILKTILRYKRQAWDVIKLRKERKGRIRVVTSEEEQQVVSLLSNGVTTKRNQHFPEVADLVIVLVDTGMRLGEALRQRYEDIDFEANLITIWENKADKPRSIPMTKRVRAILEARKKMNPAKPFNISMFQAENSWKSARKKMKLQHDKEFVLHALRHTCASRLVNRGIDLYVVKEWLGHSTIQVTEKYAHLAPDKLVHAAKALENYGAEGYV